MELKVVRQEFTDNSTIGQLLVDGEFECYTLEDKVRPSKVYGETAIPAGRYKVVITMSERFKTRLPLLVDVPGYTGVRIHPGNTKADTLGCILVGQSRDVDRVNGSRLAFNKLLPRLEAAAKSEQIFIDVIDEGVPQAAARGARGMPPPRAGKPAAKKAAAKKPAAKKPAAKKPAAKKAAAKKVAVKKAPPSKPVAKKKAAKKLVAKRRVAKKRVAKKTPVKKAAAKKAAAKKRVARKAVARKPAPRKAPAKKVAAKRVPKSVAKRAPNPAAGKPATQAAFAKAPSARAVFRRR